MLREDHDPSLRSLPSGKANCRGLGAKALERHTEGIGRSAIIEQTGRGGGEGTGSDGEKGVCLRRIRASPKSWKTLWKLRELSGLVL